jgi:Cu(I)/Ag(I) efflux system membrane protein CusA/SilA
MLIGLVPLLWAQGSGADVMKRIAAPMVGGLVTSAFLTLEIIPVIYTYWRNEQLLWRRLDEAALSILRWLERDVIALKITGTLGLGWVAMKLYVQSPPAWVQPVAVAVAMAAMALLIAYPVLRHRARRLLEQP